jgi:hypothetical protein
VIILRELAIFIVHLVQSKCTCRYLGQAWASVVAAVCGMRVMNGMADPKA